MLLRCLPSFLPPSLPPSFPPAVLRRRCCRPARDRSALLHPAAPRAGLDDLVEDLERCACADDAGAQPPPRARAAGVPTVVAQSSGELADVSLGPPDYSAYYSESAANTVAASAPSSRLSALNGYEAPADSERKPSLSERAIARVAGKPRLPVTRAPAAVNGGGTLAHNAAASARDQAAANLAETGELAGKTEAMHQNAASFAAMAASINR